MKNNNSGFTLVELLGVIVIIGILATVAGLAVFQIIHNQQEKLLEDQIATLKDTAVTYVLSKETYLESCGNALDTNNPDAIKLYEEFGFKKDDKKYILEN